MAAAQFEGSVVLITGASSGIGLATARAFAAQGAHVALIARNPERLEQAASAVRAAALASSQRVLAFPADVADEQAVRDAVAQTRADLERIDVLVNCAGIYVPQAFLEMPPELFRAHIEVDLMGVAHVTRAVAPGMVERGSGAIVNVSSMAGFVGVYGYSAYSAAKYGVMGFSEVLRSELAPHGVRVSVVCPPDVDTPGFAAERAIRPPETAKIAGSAKTVSADDIARVILKAARSKKHLWIPGASNALLYRLKGVWPELFFFVFDRQIAEVRSTKRG
ncbi:SDR family oxidoreductase [Coriobacteriia bacterium Es71-Z0120]|uniref:SDR family oxidoreductase n=1 Tax=Parvivirga hydrogeniphila TaxID=2939460 RepID=UPI002260E7AB|nr:SDR family oxidoreductase [Parvivirga hydrogeniphila]